MKRVWTGFIVVLVLIVLAQVSTIATAILSQKHVKIPATPSQPVPTEMILSSLDPIPLSRDAKWNLVSLDDPSSIYNQTHDNSLLYQDAENKPINIKGKEWWGILPNRNFFYEYSKALDSLGWKNSTTYHSREIQMLPADGPLGSTYGYIKIEKNYARIIILSIVSVSPQTLKTSGDCPCKQKYNIFVSDITPIANLAVRD